MTALQLPRTLFKIENSNGQLRSQIRIWFVLQHYSQFGFKPFMTNMEATIEIMGVRNENKK